MQSLRIIRRRMRSVENTAKLTRAMEMVAASKLKRVQNQLISWRPYFNNLEALKERLLKSCAIKHPLLTAKGEGLPVACLLFSSDTGLCGSYNTNAISRLETFLREYSKDNVRLVLIGKKGANFFRRRNYSTLFAPLDMANPKDRARIENVAKSLMEAFLQGLCSEVWLCYTKYVSTSLFKPTIDNLLPLDCQTFLHTPEVCKRQDYAIDYILEPDMSRILERLLPEFIIQKIWQAYIESFTSEQSARMFAMRSATDNASEMLDELTRLRNKIRQASITKELLEVIATSEALK